MTSAARAGVPERVIMQQTGHKSIETVLRYCPPGERLPRKRAERVGALKIETNDSLMELAIWLLSKA
jgi:hypothetical protein